MPFRKRPTNPLYRTKQYARDRAALIAAFTPGQPCCLCGHPLQSARYAEAQHIPGTDRLQGLAHGTHQQCSTCKQRCNQVDGARRGRARQNKKPVTNLKW